MPANTTIQQSLDLIKNDPSKVLGLNAAGKSLKPGDSVARADVASPPQVSFDTPNATAAYLVITLDLDAPTPSVSLLSPILQWLQSGFKPTSTPGSLSTSDPFIANYISPAPPPIGGAHRYLFILFEEPAGFDYKQYAPADGKPVGNLSRIRYDVDGFVKKAKLGAPLAANYFKTS